MLLNSNICIVAAMLLILPLFSSNAFGAGSIELSSYSTTIEPTGSLLISGKASGLAPFIPVKLTVTDPSGKVIYSPNLQFDGSGNFKYLIHPTLPQFPTGTYVVEATHRDLETPVQLEFEVQVAGAPVAPSTPKCTANELRVQGNCIPFSITGATVTSTSINLESKSIVMQINSTNTGSLNIKPSTKIIQGISMVLVDGKESKQVTIVGNDVTIPLPLGTKSVEVVGTYVIPEFGTIAMLILVMSITAIIIMTSKSKMILSPKI